MKMRVKTTHHNMSSPSLIRSGNNVVLKRSEYKLSSKSKSKLRNFSAKQQWLVEHGLVKTIVYPGIALFQSFAPVVIKKIPASSFFSARILQSFSVVVD